MIFEGMKQESGDNSTNIQVRGDLNAGITYQEAKQIALDVFNSNFYEFSEKARKIANERAEEISEKIVYRFFNEIPHLTSKLEEPSVQSSIFNAQKEYAKTGDKELEGRLLDLLMERINSNERSLKQIVLDEAILIIPKLTNDQINILTLVFSVVTLNNADITNVDKLIDYINNRVIKFYPENIASYSFFSHLQFTGCCVVLPEGATYKPFAEYSKERFKGLFSKGFSELEFKAEVDENITNYYPLMLRCFRNQENIQFNALDDNTFNEKITPYPIEVQNKLKALFEKTTMNIHEVKEFFVNTNIRMEELLKDWQESGLKTIQLTSVGNVIALMNYNNVTETSPVVIDNII